MPDEKDDVIIQDDNELDKEEETVEDSQEDKEEEQQEEEIDLEKITPEVRRQREEKKEEEDDEVDPEDNKRISKIVDKQVGNKMVEIENKIEVQSFVASKPEYAKYQGAILKYMNHPDYANIPVYNIAAIVASRDMMKLGAAKEREAQNKVNGTKTPGTTVRKVDASQKDWHSASKEDFEAQRAKVLGRQGF